MDQFLLDDIDVPEFDDAVRVADGKLVSVGVPGDEGADLAPHRKMQHTLAGHAIPDLQIRSTGKGDPWSARMRGEQMGRVSERLKSNGVKKIVFDCTELSLIDSSGVGTLVSVVRYTRAKNGTVSVANLRDQPKEVFRILNLDRAIPVFDSVDQAVKRMQ